MASKTKKNKYDERHIINYMEEYKMIGCGKRETTTTSTSIIGRNVKADNTGVRYYYPNHDTYSIASAESPYYDYLLTSDQVARNRDLIEAGRRPAVMAQLQPVEDQL